MELTEKFASLTVEQRQQICEIKNAAGLNAFLTAEGIALSAEEHAEAFAFFNTGISSLNDDDLDVAAGGQDKDKNYKAMALADGRTIPIKANLYVSIPYDHRFCSCFIEEAWAARRGKFDKGELNNSFYYDCKCYRCGHYKREYELIKMYNYD